MPNEVLVEVLLPGPHGPITEQRSFLLAARSQPDRLQEITQQEDVQDVGAIRFPGKDETWYFIGVHNGSYTTGTPEIAFDEDEDQESTEVDPAALQCLRVTEATGVICTLAGWFPFRAGTDKILTSLSESDED